MLVLAVMLNFPMVSTSFVQDHSINIPTKSGTMFSQ